MEHYFFKYWLLHFLFQFLSIKLLLASAFQMGDRVAALFRYLCQLRVVFQNFSKIGNYQQILIPILLES